MSTSLDARSKLGEFWSLTGKTALVTGGAVGVGKAIALRLAEVGAHVVVADMNEEQSQKTAALIAKNGGSAEVARMDVTDGAAVKSVIDKVAADRGKLDVLVNNAGIYPMRPFLEVDDALWEK